MDKLKIGLSGLVRNVFTQFYERGGLITKSGVEIDPVVGSSEAGLTPALVWVASIFYKDHHISFPHITYRHDARSMLGFTIDRIDSPKSASPLLLMMSDFLSEEVFPLQVVELDVGDLSANFQEWCRENAIHVPLVDEPESQHPEENP